MSAIKAFWNSILKSLHDLARFPFDHACDQNVMICILNVENYLDQMSIDVGCDRELLFLKFHPSLEPHFKTDFNPKPQITTQQVLTLN